MHHLNRSIVQTCDLFSQLPHGCKAFCSLSHTNCSASIQNIEAVAELQEVLIGRYWQLLCQQVVCLLEGKGHISQSSCSFWRYDTLKCRNTEYDS